MVLPTDDRAVVKDRIRRRVEEIKEKKSAPVTPPEIPVEEGEQIDGE